MNIVISSGKGGTGKTFIATNLAVTLAKHGRDVTFLDCDVEAPNAQLFLKATITGSDRLTVRSPVRIDEDACALCGKCVESCTYNALAKAGGKILLFDELCHACGACSLVCPTHAIIEEDKEIGHVEHGKSGAIAFHQGLAKTGVGGMSPRIISDLKRYAGTDITILDSPPGTACPVVETITGADICVLVSDPTPFSLHDLTLSVNMCRHIGVEPVVVINRAGIDDSALRDYCRRMALTIIGEIPDDLTIAEIYSRGDIVVENHPAAATHFVRLADRLLDTSIRNLPPKRDLIEPMFPEDTIHRNKRPDTTGTAKSGAGVKEVVIVSGKGGTGKTSLSACFAQLQKNGVVSDCDVDAADLHIILKPTVLESDDFVGGAKVEIQQDTCIQCGRCMEVCRFDAISKTDDGRYIVDPIRCEGCGACRIVCPANAIDTLDTVNGRWFISETRFGPMSHAALGYAEENSGKLVTLVRHNASDMSAAQTPDAVSNEDNRQHPDILIDGSPGTGCPVIASVTGASFAVAVTEPTVSGLHDLERILQLTRHFRVRTGVIINKADINPGMAESIRDAAEKAHAALLGEVDYDHAFVDAQMNGQTLLEYAPDSHTAKSVIAIWDKIVEKVQEQ